MHSTLILMATASALMAGSDEALQPRAASTHPTMVFEDADLLLRIINHGLLLALHPSSQAQQNELHRIHRRILPRRNHQSSLKSESQLHDKTQPANGLPGIRFIRQSAIAVAFMASPFWTYACHSDVGLTPALSPKYHLHVTETVW